MTEHRHDRNTNGGIAMRMSIPIALTAALVLSGCGKKDPAGAGTTVPAHSLIIDHACADLSQVPAQWIAAVKSGCRMHYAHTSHGGQLTVGLDRIETADTSYGQAQGYCSLPGQAGLIRIWDGQLHEDYITPDEYWESHAGMDSTRRLLQDNPAITHSMWSWCTQLDSYDSTQVQAYLDSISQLEGEFPSVRFIYMTGNAQATGSGGWNRHCRNQQIRRYCAAHGKVLYDFADLDAWYNGTQQTDTYNGNVFPIEHVQYNGNEAAHTTYQSCEVKGRAFWWMMARLAGWNGQ
ncbi:hypothetical protein EG831_07505 [bacterium]|nr:hypothetical protein [bacterium]